MVGENGRFEVGPIFRHFQFFSACRKAPEPSTNAPAKPADLNNMPGTDTPAGPSSPADKYIVVNTFFLNFFPWRRPEFGELESVSS